MASLPDIVSYRANLTSPQFPFLTELKGRSVILQGIDQESDIPQAYYMHNVLATQKGYTSIGYSTVALSPADQDGTFFRAFRIRDASDNVALFCRTKSGRNYILPNLALGWIRTTDVVTPVGAITTIAYINGVTYICFGLTNVYKYDFATNTLILVVLTGLAAGNVLGICASNGYMLAWTATTVVWSSLLSPSDFTPSLVTGAGGGNIQSTKAQIVVCAPQNTGFIIYTKANAVSATYTGNSNFPFTFKEVQGSGGISEAGMVASDGNSGSHLIYGTNGLQQVTANISSVIYPELTDFIAGSEFEDYDEISQQFFTTPLVNPMQKKLVVIANRYLVFSYGVTQLTHALVYDISLQRWGKLKVTHVDCFEYSYPSSTVVDAPKRSIGFLTFDGQISVAVINYDTSGSNGVLLLGKYQLDRNRLSSMQELAVESIRYGTVLRVTAYVTLDGLTLQPYIPTLVDSASTYRKYNADKVGMNHSILFTGAFNLTSLEFKFIDEGEA